MWKSIPCDHICLGFCDISNLVEVKRTFKRTVKTLVKELSAFERLHSCSGYCEPPPIPFVNHKGKESNSDWLPDQWDQRSVLGHAWIYKEK